MRMDVRKWEERWGNLTSTYEEDVVLEKSMGG